MTTKNSPIESMKFPGLVLVHMVGVLLGGIEALEEKDGLWSLKSNMVISFPNHANMIVKCF